MHWEFFFIHYLFYHVDDYSILTAHAYFTISVTMLMITAFLLLMPTSAAKSLQVQEQTKQQKKEELSHALHVFVFFFFFLFFLIYILYFLMNKNVIIINVHSGSIFSSTYK